MQPLGAHSSFGDAACYYRRPAVSLRSSAIVKAY